METTKKPLFDDVKITDYDTGFTLSGKINLVNKEKPFSETLRGLLHFAKKHEEPFTFKALQKHLGPEYHPSMRLKDVLIVINNALLEMLEIDAFEIGNKRTTYLEIIMSPFDGIVPLGDSILFGPSIDDKFTIEQFYDKIIATYMHKFMFTNIGWCRSYVFPEEKEKDKINE